MSHQGVYIDPAAHVSEKAIIGRGTKIWINAQVREGATIGLDCIVSKDTYIDTKVKMGDRVKVQNGVSIYHGVEIEDDVFIGPNAAFTNDYQPRSFNKDWKVTPTFVRRGASIGANATIICGVTIGEYAMIGAGSVVTHNVPRHALMVGNPARLIGYVCCCGARAEAGGICPECGMTVPACPGEES